MKQFVKKMTKTNMQNGQGLVEFAWSLPMFLLLIVAVMEIGWATYFYSSVFTASREGSRYASGSGYVNSSTHYYQDCDGIRARAIGKGVGINLVKTDITIFYDSPNDNVTATEYCQSTKSVDTSVTLALGNRVIVKVKKTFNFAIPIINQAAIPITAISYRTIITGVDVSSALSATSTY